MDGQLQLSIATKMGNELSQIMEPLPKCNEQHQAARYAYIVGVICL
jgi:hypothetical protein